ncbi:hypothetical protein ACHZ98_34455 [Streptomyces sp. MAR4 CNY-716]
MAADLRERPFSSFTFAPVDAVGSPGKVAHASRQPTLTQEFPGPAQGGIVQMTHRMECLAVLVRSDKAAWPSGAATLNAVISWSVEFRGGRPSGKRIWHFSALGGGRRVARGVSM